MSTTRFGNIRYVAAVIAVAVAACSKSSSPGPAQLTPQSECEAACNHELAANCAATVQLTTSHGGCTSSCATGISQLNDACTGVYMDEQNCFANAPITCDAQQSVNTSLFAACASQNQEVVACQKIMTGAGDSGADGSMMMGPPIVCEITSSYGEICDCSPLYVPTAQNPLPPVGSGGACCGFNASTSSHECMTTNTCARDSDCQLLAPALSQATCIEIANACPIINGGSWCCFTRDVGTDTACTCYLETNGLVGNGNGALTCDQFIAYSSTTGSGSYVNPMKVDHCPNGAVLGNGDGGIGTCHTNADCAYGTCRSDGQCITIGPGNPCTAPSQCDDGVCNAAGCCAACMPDGPLHTCFAACQCCSGVCVEPSPGAGMRCGG